MAELDEIEQSLAHLEMPASYGNAPYSLRSHVAQRRGEAPAGSRAAAE